MAEGFGQQTPYDTTSNLAEVSFIIRQMLARMNTMKVVKVIAVHNTGGVAQAGTVDVQPLVSQIDGNNNATPHGTVPGVQYFRLQGGPNAIICDPVVGDVGYVIVSDRDITNIKNGQSSPVTPGSFRRNDLADGIYVGGILNNKPTQYIQFTSTGINVVDSNGNQIQFTQNGVTIADKNGNQIQMGSGGITIVGNLTVQNNLVAQSGLQLGGALTAIGGGTYTGNLQVQGNVVAGFGGGDQIGLLTHTHAGVQPGVGSTAPPSPGT